MAAAVTSPGSRHDDGSPHREERDTGNTFERIVAMSGLAPMFARSVVKRTIERAGLSPDTLKASEVTGLLPDLERALSAFLGNQTGGRMDKIRELVRSAE
jgi:hypothetical protein